MNQVLMPTNSDILNEIKSLQKGFEAHIESDLKEFEGIKSSIRINTFLIQETHENVDNMKGDLVKLLKMKESIDDLLNIIAALTTGKKIIIGLALVIGSFVSIVIGLKTIGGWIK